MPRCPVAQQNPATDVLSADTSTSSDSACSAGEPEAEDSLRNAAGNTNETLSDLRIRRSSSLKDLAAFDFDALDDAMPATETADNCNGASNCTVESAVSRRLAGRKLFSLRYVVDADPIAVGAAIAQALLEGQPGSASASSLQIDSVTSRMDSETSTRMAAQIGSDPPLVPWPVAPEWEHLGAHKSPARVFLGNVYGQAHSYSFGLRPLQEGDTVAADPDATGAYFVDLKRGYRGHITAYEEQTFCVKEIFTEIATYLDVHATVFPGAGIFCSNRVRTLECADGGQRTELIRDVFEGGWCMMALLASIRPGVEGSPVSKDGKVTSLVLDYSNGWLRTSPGMLWAVCAVFNIETQAWLRVHRFPLVELWRGLRRNEPFCISIMLNMIMDFTLGPGNAALADPESRLGPRFDVAHARRLADELPKRPPQTCPQGHLTEGNVRVESFAAVLDRVCRRSSAKADIYRKFVDLGSGRGIAVLTAYALFPFRSCVGIEVVRERVATARELARTCSAHGLLRKTDTARQLNVDSLFVVGDFSTDLDWSDASVVLINGLTWPQDLVRQVALGALRLAQGAVVLMMSQTFPNDPAILEAFDLRGDACLGHWADNPEHIWVYQRV